MKIKRNKYNDFILFDMKTRYSQVDILKIYSCIAVIFIHVLSWSDYYWYLYLFRFAVPCFFLINGFFYRPDNYKKRVLKAFYLFLSANFLYLIWDILFRKLTGEYTFNTVGLSLRQIVTHFLVWNESPLEWHLWYLGAYLYAVILMKPFVEHVNEFIRIIISSVLLLMGVFLGKYSLVFFGVDHFVCESRNWLFLGLPLITIGYSIKLHYSELKDRVKVVPLIAIALISLTVTYLENRYFVAHEIWSTGDIFFSTPILTISLFLLVLLYGKSNQTVISEMGRKYSTGIYIIHFVFFELIMHYFPSLCTSKKGCLLEGILVFILSLVSVMIYQKLTSIVKRNNDFQTSKGNPNV